MPFGVLRKVILHVVHPLVGPEYVDAHYLVSFSNYIYCRFVSGIGHSTQFAGCTSVLFELICSPASFIRRLTRMSISILASPPYPIYPLPSSLAQVHNSRRVETKPFATMAPIECMRQGTEATPPTFGVRRSRLRGQQRKHSWPQWLGKHCQHGQACITTVRPM